MFSESESCNSVFVTVWYHFFFSHLFFNAVLQNIELCLDSFNAMTATGFNNNLSNLFFYIIVFSGSGNLANVGSFHFKTILMFVNCLKHSWYKKNPKKQKPQQLSLPFAIQNKQQMLRILLF